MQIVSTPAAPAAIGPYAQGVIAAGLLYTSGQIPLDADGHFVAGDIEVQTTQVLANLRAVIEAAGAGFADVIRTTVYVADLDDFPRLNAVYARHFGEHRPARSTVQVARLPRDARIEIEAIVRLPG